jgi:hypothetical protein
MNIERLIRDAIDAWTMWRIERRMFKASPDFAKKVLDLRKARRQHRETAPMLRAIRDEKTAMLRRAR